MKNKIGIAFIGCGNMARAIISSMTDPASVAALKANGKVFRIIAADRDEAKLTPLNGVCGITLDSAHAVAESDYVFLAVKPQDAAAALDGLDLRGKTVISIMAGVTIDRLKSLTGADRIVRVMPNLNARVGESFNAYTAVGISSGEATQTVLEILGSFGAYSEVDEREMDAVTGITGSGPAFVFSVIKAFRDEAVARGFDAEQAKRMAVQTVIGSALTVEKSADDLDALISSVCSKGGTTIAGVEFLKANNFENILRGAISESIARSCEMSKA
ncbi:MAG: pyrroline-5-carboxylate reductase [Roseburia sp.]|nr:pyrroline-5-carboxylate reductase [Roseburia sp.]